MRLFVLFEIIGYQYTFTSKKTKMKPSWYVTTSFFANGLNSINMVTLLPSVVQTMEYSLCYQGHTFVKNLTCPKD